MVQEERFILEKKKMYYKKDEGFISNKNDATIFNTMAEANKVRKKLYKSVPGTIFILSI